MEISQQKAVLNPKHLNCLIYYFFIYFILFMYLFFIYVIFWGWCGPQAPQIVSRPTVGPWTLILGTPTK